jgi:NAD(P)-dependent dehydrogenase (short-subunit alcohol dehydrogenase family)
VLTMSTGAMHFPVQFLSGFSAYGASKAGQFRVLEMLSAECGEDVRFVTVHPGLIETAMGKKSGLIGIFPMSEKELPADWMVWATRHAEWLDGRFLWAGWDVEELEARKEEIKSKDLLTFKVKGVPIE